MGQADAGIYGRWYLLRFSCSFAGGRAQGDYLQLDGSEVLLALNNLDWRLRFRDDTDFALHCDDLRGGKFKGNFLNPASWVISGFVRASSARSILSKGVMRAGIFSCRSGSNGGEVGSAVVVKPLELVQAVFCREAGALRR